MNNSRITRNLARSNEEPTRSIPRSDSEQESDKETETEPEIKLKPKTKAKALDKTLDKKLPESSRTTMAVQAIPLKDVLTVVPEFNGENIPLSRIFKRMRRSQRNDNSRK